MSDMLKIFEAWEGEAAMSKRIYGDSLVILFAGVVASALAGCSSPDILQAAPLDTHTGQPIPVALPDPGKWVFIGTQTVPGKYQHMEWVKPVHMEPRPFGTSSMQVATQMAGSTGEACGSTSGRLERIIRIPGYGAALRLAGGVS